MYVQFHFVSCSGLLGTQALAGCTKYNIVLLGKWDLLYDNSIASILEAISEALNELWGVLAPAPNFPLIVLAHVYEQALCFVLMEPLGSQDQI